MLARKYFVINRVVGCVIAVWLGGGVLAWGPQAPPYRPGKPIAIVGGLLIDATGGPPRMDQTVVIQGERIAAIGPMDTIAVPDGAEVIDAAGLTVMPGLNGGAC